MGAHLEFAIGLDESDEGRQGLRAMNLIGNVVKMDVDADGKASGAYLQAMWPSKLINPYGEGCSYV